MTGRLFRTVCLLASAAAILVLEPVNCLQSIPPFVHVATVGFGLLGFVLYREALCRRYHYWTFYLLLMVTFDATWFLDAGADGSIGLVLFGGAFVSVLFFTGWTRILALSLFFAERYFTEHTDLRFTHGICPECANRVGGDLERATRSPAAPKMPM